MYVNQPGKRDRQRTVQGPMMKRRQGITVEERLDGAAGLTKGKDRICRSLQAKVLGGMLKKLKE